MTNIEIDRIVSYFMRIVERVFNCHVSYDISKQYEHYGFEIRVDVKLRYMEEPIRNNIRLDGRILLDDSVLHDDCNNLLMFELEMFYKRLSDKIFEEVMGNTPRGSSIMSIGDTQSSYSNIFGVSPNFSMIFDDPLRGDEPTDPNEGKTDDELYLERCGG